MTHSNVLYICLDIIKHPFMTARHRDEDPLAELKRKVLNWFLIDEQYEC